MFAQGEIKLLQLGAEAETRIELHDVMFTRKIDPKEKV